LPLRRLEETDDSERISAATGDTRADEHHAVLSKTYATIIAADSTLVALKLFRSRRRLLSMMMRREKYHNTCVRNRQSASEAESGEEGRKREIQKRGEHSIGPSIDCRGDLGEHHRIEGAPFPGSGTTCLGSAAVEIGAQRDNVS
jgi:hypothetical protein